MADNYPNEATRKAAEAQMAAASGEVTAESGGDTREELMKRAGEVGVEGRSSMNKEELAAAIRERQTGGVNRPRELGENEADPAKDQTVEDVSDNPTPEPQTAAVPQRSGSPADSGVAAAPATGTTGTATAR